MKDAVYLSLILLTSGAYAGHITYNATRPMQHPDNHYTNNTNNTVIIVYNNTTIIDNGSNNLDIPWNGTIDLNTINRFVIIIGEWEGNLSINWSIIISIPKCSGIFYAISNEFYNHTETLVATTSSCGSNETYAAHKNMGNETYPAHPENSYYAWWYGYGVMEYSIKTEN